jgi:hypothetical protein
MFDRGAIYWWPDVGAIELGDLVVHYTGLIAFGETDWDGDETPFADEPYAVIDVTSPDGTNTVRTQVYDDVDAGEGRPDLIELYRGRPAGVVLSVQLMEHDYGNPDQFKDHVRKFVEEASHHIEKGLEYIPIFGPAISDGAEALLEYLKEPITDFLNEILDTDDDDLQRAVVTLSAKQMVVLAARTPNSADHGVGFKAETPILGSNDGASYKVYFGLVSV